MHNSCIAEITFSSSLWFLAYFPGNTKGDFLQNTKAAHSGAFQKANIYNNILLQVRYAYHYFLNKMGRSEL